MAWFESAADLPAPRDDEPAHLRQDIQDELADHLQSALERELRQHTDETTARKCVLQRFGDPRRVARKLWWDAMREKLMSQRVQMVASVLMLVACGGMFWMTSKIADQGRVMNEALLARLDNLSQPQTPAFNPEWNPTVVQLVTESGEQLPKGFEVRLECHALKFEQSEKADPSGRADFGLQQPGTYLVRVRAPSGDWCETIEMPLRAGRPFNLKVTCPTEPAEIEAPIVLNWPQTLDSPDLMLACQVSGKPRAVGGMAWGYHSTHQFLLDHSGKIVPCDGIGMEVFQSQTAVQPVGAWLDGRSDTGAQSVKFHATSDREATIGLPVNFAPEATIALLKIQEGEPGKPAAVQVGHSIDVPLELERGQSAHWTLTIPDRFESKTDEREAALAPRNAARPAPAQ